MGDIAEKKVNKYIHLMHQNCLEAFRRHTEQFGIKHTRKKKRKKLLPTALDTHNFDYNHKQRSNVAF